MANRAAPDVHFGDLSHLDGRLHSGMDFEFFEGILQGERIDDSCQHSHVIGRNTIKSLRAGGKSTENVSAPNDDTDFDTQVMNVSDLRGDSLDDLRIDTESLIAHQSFTAELQQNPTVFGRFHFL
jgi:hypothetical protein